MQILTEPGRVRPRLLPVPIQWRPVLWLLAVAPTTAVAQGGTIIGSVRDSLHDVPLHRVEVFLKGTTRRAISDEAGSFRFEGLSPGRYELGAYRLGYFPTSLDIILQTRVDTAHMQIALSPVPPDWALLEAVPDQTACGTGLSRADEWLADLDTVAAYRLRLKRDVDKLAVENVQLCAVLQVVAVRYVLDNQLWREWLASGRSLAFDWSRVIGIMSRVGSTAIVEFGVFEVTTLGEPSPRHPRVDDKRVFVTVDLATLEVIGSDIRSW